LVVAAGLVGCGGAAFVTGAEPGDDGGAGDALLGAEAGTEVAQGEDAGRDAGGEVVGHVVGQEGGAADAGQTSEASADGGDAGHEAEAGPPCLTDLSGVGTGDFGVAFTLTTTATTFSALVNQSATCQASCGGSASVEWDIFMTNTGSIQVETDDGVAADRVFQVGGGPVNDGHPHSVVVGRTSGKVWVQTDGARSPLVSDANSLGTLPPLVVGRDPCAISPGYAGCPAVLPLVGSVTDLCLTK